MKKVLRRKLLEIRKNIKNKDEKSEKIAKHVVDKFDIQLDIFLKLVLKRKNLMFH